MTLEGAMALIGGLLLVLNKLAPTLEEHLKARKRKAEDARPVTNGSATKLRDEMGALSRQMAKLDEHVTTLSQQLTERQDVMQGEIDWVRDLAETSARDIVEIKRRDGEL